MAESKALSVSAAVGLAKNTVKGLPQLSVVGEVSGFRGPNARSGHCYFSVKDEGSAMDVIVWKGVYQVAGFELRDGLEVTLDGSFDVYERSGRLSFVARRLSMAGEGLLRQKVSELARRLEAEGLMDPARKRRVPAFCERICVVTSLSGAVIDDVKRTLARRNPLVVVDVVGCAVQGEHAPATIVEGLARAAADAPDAVLLVRGGGSFEDLMAFNDESVARAVAACPVPVVTGIGHEPDNSIADMVADRRCSTPTAAAESVAPDFATISSTIEERAARLPRALGHAVAEGAGAVDTAAGRLVRAAAGRLGLERARLEAMAQRPVLTSPMAIVDLRRATLEQLSDELTGAVDRDLAARALLQNNLAAGLDRAARGLLLAPANAVQSAASGLARAATAVTDPFASRLGADAAALEALSPVRVMARGYAIVEERDGHVVDSVAKARPGQEIAVKLQDGSLEATVTSVIPDPVR